MTQEVLETKDNLLKEECQKKIETIKEQIISFTNDYNDKKAAWEKMRKFFEDNKSLEVQIQEWESQAKEFEAKSAFDKVSELRYGKISEAQKTIKFNLEESMQLQKVSGITIKNTVEIEDIAQIVSEKTGIPLTRMVSEESQKLANLESYLSTKVIGQEEAITEISNAIRRARIGYKDPKKPIGSFLFL